MPSRFDAFLGAPDRLRLLEMEQRLTLPRTVGFAALALLALRLVPEHGWWGAVLVGLGFVVAASTRPFLQRAVRPERYIVAVAIINQSLMAVSIGVTGGTDSPLLFWVLLVVVALPSRVAPRAVWAGCAMTVVLVLIGIAIDDPAAIIADPRALSVVALTVGVTAFLLPLMRAEDDYRHAAGVDPLTGVLNRRSLDQRLAVRLDADVDTWLVMCDIDHFKQINDGHGHDVGDRVLQDLAGLLQDEVRPQDEVFRLGGEEFLILLADADRDVALAVAERARARVESTRAAGVSVTASFGVCAAVADADFTSAMAGADAALYEAKRSGRNRVVCGLA
ncbi:MAG: diguanylate cyclase [Solirubrobacteraceae bacterium]|nr:diguanylate cyclase [Solirubrobacteraceae bacterium]